MKGKISQYMFPLVSVFVLVWMVPRHVWADQPETAISCAGVSEPIALNYGNHTTGCVIDPATDSDVFTFAGNQSETLRFAIFSGTAGLDLSFQVYDPSGSQILKAACSGTGACSPSGCAAIQCSVSKEAVLPLPGTYTIAVSEAQTDEVGAYTLVVERIFPPLGKPTISFDAFTDDEISPGPDVDLFSFSGAAGSRVRFSVLSGTNGLDPQVEVYDPSGSQILKAACSGTGACSPSGCASIKCSISQEVVLPLSGTYAIALSEAQSDESGRYNLNVQCLLGKCSSSGTPSPLPSTAALESPADGQVVSGISLLRGWAFGPSANPVSNIKLFVDGKETDDIPFPSKRGDVAAAYPNEPNALRSGFGSIVNYGNLSQGPHTIEVRVIARDGTSRSLVRNVVALRFAGFEFVDGNLSSVTTRNEGNEVVIQGVQIRDTQSGQTRTVTVRIQFDKASQGFVVTDIK